MKFIQKIENTLKNTFFNTFSDNNQQRGNMYFKVLLQTYIAYEGLYMKVYVFEDLLILNILYQRYIANLTFSNLLNCVLHFAFTIPLKKQAKKKKKKTLYLSEAKTEEKQNSSTIIISVHEKGTIFPVKLKLQEESFE